MNIGMRQTAGPQPFGWLRRLVVGATVAGVASGLLATPAGASTTTVSVQASTSGWPVGVDVSTFGYLSGATNATGTLRFRLYGPGDDNCSALPLFTNAKAVTGNGTYRSDGFTTTMAGTYRWVAAYAGDTNDSAAVSDCSAPSAVVMVGKRTPMVEGNASLISGSGTVTNTATLSNGAGPTGPKGTMSFSVYGPDNMTCAGPPVFTSSMAVSGNGTYTSSPYLPQRGGTYRWIIRYSGDANNHGAGNMCSDQASSVTIQPPRDPGDPAPVLNDFNGNGKTDPTIFRPSKGTWHPAGSPAFAWGGTRGDIPVPGDFDGNGESDFAVYRPGNGTWYVPGRDAISFGGIAGDVPVPADYNGDGIIDMAVYRPVNGTWYIRGEGAISWGGTPGDVPVPGDYDGDGDADVAVYRPATGVWYLQGVGAVAYGSRGDIPTPADYDGDGDTDVAIYRPADGTWYIRDIAAIPWGGTAGDIPVAADYDGDGDAEPAVYRPADGTWYLRGVGAFPWGGMAGDVPLSLPHAIRTAFFPLLGV